MSTEGDAVGPLPEQGQQPPEAVTKMVRLIRETWAEVEPAADETAQYCYSILFHIAPGTRELFPVNLELQQQRLMRAMSFIVRTIDRPDELLPFLQRLGRDHRKFGVLAQHYEDFGTALLGAIKRQLGDQWTSEVERAWAEAYTIVARSMQEAAAADTEPAYYNARVAEHRRLSWDLAQVRVVPDQPVPYRAGQYVSVEVPQRPRLWRDLSPANAPRDDGSIEFHVKAVDGGWVSRSIVSHTQSGDVWRLGAPRGQLGVDRMNGRDVVMIGGGTGITPLRAILDDLAGFGHNPAVHVFYGGRTRDDLYDIEQLRGMAATNPWLSVTPVVEHGEGLNDSEQGTLVDVVTRYGAWPDHDVLVAGSPEMIRATVSRMLVAGTALDQIRYDPFTYE